MHKLSKIISPQGLSSSSFFCLSFQVQKLSGSCEEGKIKIKVKTKDWLIEVVKWFKDIFSVFFQLGFLSVYFLIFDQLLIMNILFNDN